MLQKLRLLAALAVAQKINALTVLRLLLCEHSPSRSWLSSPACLCVSRVLYARCCSIPFPNHRHNLLVPSTCPSMANSILDSTGDFDPIATFLYQSLLIIPWPRSIDTPIRQNAIVANKALPCTKAIHTSL